MGHNLEDFEDWVEEAVDELLDSGCDEEVAQEKLARDMRKCYCGDLKYAEVDWFKVAAELIVKAIKEHELLFRGDEFYD